MVFRIFKYLRYLGVILNDIVRFFVIYFPGPTGRKLRYLYWKGKFKKCGKNVIIDEGVIIQNPEWISIGDNVWIDKYCILIAGPVNEKEINLRKKDNKNFKGIEGELIIEENVHLAPFCIIQAHGGVFIGKNCGFSSGVKLYSLSNLPSDPSNPSKLVYFTPLNRDNSIYLMGPIVIKENVGIALNSIVLPNVTIHENSFIAPNSVVMSNIPENSYAAGNPAKVIKERFKMEEKSE